MKKKIYLWSVVEDLSQDQEQSITGGACSCACMWANCGGSSKSGNDSANSQNDFISHQDCCCGNYD